MIGWKVVVAEKNNVLLIISRDLYTVIGFMLVSLSLVHARIGFTHDFRSSLYLLLVSGFCHVVPLTDCLEST
jgi:hypothetical protein